ncbi:MAG: hypothetical protein ACO1OG_01280 [Devosia sp.]
MSQIDAAILTDLPEYRNRYRDAASGDAAIIAATRLWPLASRDYDLQIMLLSGEGLSKCRDGIDALLSQLTPRTLLTVVCGEVEDGEPLAGDNVELLVFPGESVFELRARIPQIAREVGWIGLMEDHAAAQPGWVAAALAAIASAPDDQLAFTAAVSNDRSTTPWAWANFLFNFAFHWAPSAAPELPGTVTSLFFRRDLVGSRPFAVHAFESTVLGRTGPVRNDVLVDHKQQVNWWEASTHVFDNGLVAGSALRRHHNSPRRAMRQSVRWVLGGRQAAIAEALKQHPRYAELPPGTIGRVHWIGLCHSAGTIWGALFGAGRAQHRLE